jgi:hypothetical protein
MCWPRGSCDSSRATTPQFYRAAAMQAPGLCWHRQGSLSSAGNQPALPRSCQAGPCYPVSRGCQKQATTQSCVAAPRQVWTSCPPAAVPGVCGCACCCSRQQQAVRLGEEQMTVLSWRRTSRLFKCCACCACLWLWWSSVQPTKPCSELPPTESGQYNSHVMCQLSLFWVPWRVVCAARCTCSACAAGSNRVLHDHPQQAGRSKLWLRGRRACTM